MSGDEEIRFLGTPSELAALREGYAIKTLTLLIHSFSWWKRCIAWCLWRTRMKKLLERRFRSPYETLDATLVPIERLPNPPDTSAESKS